MIKQYLKSISKILTNKNQKEYYNWILANGKLFNGKQIKPIETPNNERKKCFYNSQMLALSEKYEYWEGWYVTKCFPLPFEHGWNMLDGNIIDVTAYGKFEVNEYFGVKIPIGYIRKMLLKTGYSDGYLGRYYYEVILNGNITD